jgi:AcrR family transcriptional regulator
MPPKVKVTREQIINTALDIVRKEGIGAVNARSVAAAIGCSTQPVFSNFENMEQLQSAVGGAAYSLYLDCQASEVKSGKYPPYKAYGMAYIRFAKEEKELFKLLFMCDRRGKDVTPSADFEKSVELIMGANGVGDGTARLMHLEIWACVHGIAVMHATSFLELDVELVSDMLSDVYRGLQLKNGGNI